MDRCENGTLMTRIGRMVADQKKIRKNALISTQGAAID
jgi:hypothetical protein